MGEVSGVVVGHERIGWCGSRQAHQQTETETETHRRTGTGTRTDTDRVPVTGAVAWERRDER